VRRARASVAMGATDELHPEQEPRDEEAGQHQADVEVGITHRRLNTRGIIHTTITALKKTMAKSGENTTAPILRSNGRPGRRNTHRRSRRRVATGSAK